MKQTLLIAILLLLIPNLALPVVALNGQPAKRKLESMRYWRPGSVVNVYFFRNMFTSEQRQVSLGALEYWEASASAGPAVSFNYAGETDGLIDCHNCLTVARQETYAGAGRGRASFNALRRNDLGELISAWIGIEHSARDSVGLRRLIFEALGGVRGIQGVRRSAIGSEAIESAAEVRSGVPSGC